MNQTAHSIRTKKTVKINKNDNLKQEFYQDSND